MTRPIVQRPVVWLFGAAVAGVVLWGMSGLAVAQDKAKPEASDQPTNITRAPNSVTARRAQPAQIRAAANTEEFQGPPRPGSSGIKVEPAGTRTKAPEGKAKGRAVPQPTVVLKPGEVPAIKFDVPVYDFGRVRAGEDVIHDFWFTNTGTGPLEILTVKPG
jgi:hypothetical protein